MVTEFQSHYIPNTVVEQKQLLDSIGLGTIDDLFQDIPDAYRNPSLDLPGPMSELDIQRELGELASRNRPLASGPSFLGAGCYHHFIPAIVKALMTRGEFLTAYTPYQPEVSQGTLQVIFEFQTMVSALYGMEVANAGMYDGATSLAEATLMACRGYRAKSPGRLRQCGAFISSGNSHLLPGSGYRHQCGRHRRRRRGGQ